MYRPALEFGGDFSGVGGFANGGSIADPFVAQVLDGRTGCDTALGLPAGGIYALGGGTNFTGVPWSSVFPSGAIPTACQDPVAANLLQRFVPAGQSWVYLYQVVPVGTINADQFTARCDHRINEHQSLTAYYYFNDNRELDPYNTFEEAGATLPGFGSYNNSRDQQWNFTHTWTISNALVNEAHFTYMREGELGYLKNQTTNAVTASCTGAAATPYCFTGLSDSSTIQTNFGTAANLGITPGLPANLTGVPFVNISGGASYGNNFEGFPAAGWK